MEKWEIEMLNIYNRPLLKQSQQWKHQTHPAINNKVNNRKKVNNKVNKRNTRTSCEICSKLIKTPERHHCYLWAGKCWLGKKVWNVFKVNKDNRMSTSRALILEFGKKKPTKQHVTSDFVGKKTKGWISKCWLQENKLCRIFEKQTFLTHWYAKFGGLWRAPVSVLIGYICQNSSVITQKGESQSGCFKKTARQIFRKINISYPLIRTRTHTYFLISNNKILQFKHILNYFMWIYHFLYFDPSRPNPGRTEN